MKRQGAPFDASEPPGGDFVRYVERLNAASAVQAADEAAGHAARARQAQADADAPRPATTAIAGSAARAAHAAAARARPAARPPVRRPATWGPPSTMVRAAAWMIGAGVALVLLAVLSSDSAFVDTFLPGMLLIGAGLAFRKHFRRR